MVSMSMPSELNSAMYNLRRRARFTGSLTDRHKISIVHGIYLRQYHFCYRLCATAMTTIIIANEFGQHNIIKSVRKLIIREVRGTLCPTCFEASLENSSQALS